MNIENQTNSLCDRVFFLNLMSLGYTYLFDINHSASIILSSICAVIGLFIMLNVRLASIFMAIQTGDELEYVKNLLSGNNGLMLIMNVATMFGFLFIIIDRIIE